MTSKPNKTVSPPKLRFKQFEGEWELVKLKDISVPVTEKVGKRKLTPVSISAGIGFVPQAEKFGRDISGNQYELYTLVRDGDFVFNKGNSKTFPEGCIYLLEDWGEVAAPNVFISFRLKKGYVNGFFQYIFEKNTHGRELRPHITSGARSNGLLNISKETFFGIQLPVTSEAEQAHIAAALSSLDAVINAEAAQLEALRQHKQGLMQQLFPAEGERVPRVRFKEFEDAGEWEEKKLGDCLEYEQPTPYLVKTTNYDDSHKTPVLTAGKTFILGYTNEEDGIYDKGLPVIIFDDFTTAIKFVEFPFKAKSSAMKILSAKPSNNTHFIFAAMQMINYQVGVHERHWISIFAPMSLLVPTLPEQNRIAAVLSSLDELITTQAAKVDTLRQFKRGLMQGLFPRASTTEVNE